MTAESPIMLQPHTRRGVYAVFGRLMRHFHKPRNPPGFPGDDILKPRTPGMKIYTPNGTH